MKKVLLVGSIIFSLFLNAQTTPAGRTCGTGILPQQFESWVQGLTPAQPGKNGVADVQSVFNIPVIVHVIHNNESVNGPSATSGNNLNAAQVVDQINSLNKDYNGTNADSSLIPAVFKPVFAKCRINFCLAVVNPTGGVLAEPGIDRINRVSKGWSSMPYSQTYIDATVKPNSIWDPNKYFNIWVCPLSGGLLGYATFPNPASSGVTGLGSPFGSATSDGVVILNTSFGSIGTAQFGQYNKGRTLTHEAGHWLGLRHIWGDGTCATDYCNDTPPAQTSNYGCPSFPHNVGTCSGNTTGEMTMNYMDYTDDACLYMFTADQKNRMQLILTNSPFRLTLITSTVCNLPSVTNDIGISYVAVPGYSQTLNCTNTITPVINITNYGTSTLNSAIVSFNIDGVNTQTVGWSGALAPNSSTTFALPQMTVSSFGAHAFSVNVASPNGGSDANASNNNNLQNFWLINNMTFNPQSASTCIGNAVVLSAAGANSYSWSTGAATSSISVNPSATTIYTVTATSGICSVTKPVTVTVVQHPTLSINTQTICSGVPSDIVASGADAYSWSNGSISQTINITLLTPTVFTLTGLNNPNCPTTQTFNISVNSGPTPSVPPLAHVSCGSCADATITASASGGTGAYTYTWTPGSTTGAVLANAGIGCYTVTAADALGCANSTTVCVDFDESVFNHSIGSLDIKVSPNPSQDVYTVDYPANSPASITVIDALGRVIHTENVTEQGSIKINLASAAKGIYYLKVYSEKGQAVVKLLKD
jgi:hypothetical protein